MPHPNVTIRHTRSALRLLISGAVRDIETFYVFEENKAARDAIATLHSELAEEIGQGGLPYETGGATVQS
jgi:hypothetical protein